MKMNTCPVCESENLKWVLRQAAPCGGGAIFEVQCKDCGYSASITAREALIAAWNAGAFGGRTAKHVPPRPCSNCSSKTCYFQPLLNRR